MNFIRTIAVVFSLLAHATLGYAMLPHVNELNADALDAGAGKDAITMEQGISIEGVSKLGDALETIDTVEIAPVQKTAPPIEEIKAVDELRDVVSSEASEVQDNIVKTEEPPPSEVKEKKPEEVVVKEQQPAQLAMHTQQSSGEEKSGGDPEAYALYRGQINQRVQKSAVSPRARFAGEVVMDYTIGLRGELISKRVTASSGYPALDDAALAAIDRAAPFPPIPPEVSAAPIAFTQRFRFSVR